MARAARNRRRGNIEQRRLGWYAILNVPVDAQKKLRRRRFLKSLETRDESTAKRRAAPLVAEWKSEIVAVRNQAEAKEDAHYWREVLRNAGSEERRQELLEQVGDAAYEIGAINVEHIGDPPSKNPEARKFYAEATGMTVPTLDHVDEYIASLQVKDKTAKMRRAAIGRLAKKFPMLNDVSRKEVRHWVTELMASSAPATIRRMLSDCRTYWAYLETIEAVSEDSAPFDKLGLKVKNISWLPFEPADVVTLLDAAKRRGDDQLADLIKMGMYSGARREELCALPVANVKSDCFEIADAKTAAGIRTVPIHKELTQTMARLVDQSKDGFILSGLTANKFAVRGDAMGKRFTTLKKALGFGDRQVFHSIRGTVITMLERAEVPEGTVQDLVGHERSTLTGSTYSGKSTLEMRRKALARLAY